MFKTIALAILSALTTSLLVSVLFYLTTKPERVVTVDVGRVTKLFVNEEAKKHHSEKQKAKAIKAFSVSLENALQYLSEKNAVVILPKEAVFKGGTDYTDQLIAEIALEKGQ